MFLRNQIISIKIAALAVHHLALKLGTWTGLQRSISATMDLPAPLACSSRENYINEHGPVLAAPSSFAYLDKLPPL